MNKNIAIGLLAAIAIVVAVIIISLVSMREGFRPVSYVSQPETFDAAFFQKDEAELDAIGEDLEIYNQESAFFEEMDQIFGDIMDANETALDEKSILQESSESDFSQDLSALESDDAAANEINQFLDEILQ